MNFTLRQIVWLLLVFVLTAVCYIPVVFHTLTSALPQPFGFILFACSHSALLIFLYVLAPSSPAENQTKDTQL